MVFYLLQSFVALEWPIIQLFVYLGFVDVFGKTIILGTTVIIGSQCSGFFSIFVYLAIIFSPITKLTWKQKIKAFLIGSGILYVANIFRLFIFFDFAKYFGIEFLHILGWFLMSAIIFALWYYYNFFKNKF